MELLFVYYFIKVNLPFVCTYLKDPAVFSLQCKYYGLPVWLQYSLPLLDWMHLSVLKLWKKKRIDTVLNLNWSRLKVAFSRKGLWKYILLRFFIIFSSKFFDGACDWLRVEIWIQIQPITSSIKKFRGKSDEKSEKGIFS